MIRRGIAKIIYYFYEALRKIKRHIGNNIVTMLTIGLALFVFSVFFSLGMKFSGYIKVSQARLNKVDVYLSPDLSKKEINLIEDSLLNFKQVKTVKFISSDQGLKFFKEQIKDEQDILEGVVIPPEFEVHFINKSGINDALVKKIRHMSGVIDVYYDKQIVGNLLEVAKIIKFLGYVILIVLAASVLLIISNTIRLSLYQFREEIEIMLLSGATNWFVRWPFLIVGMVQGVVGALFAVLCTKLFFYYILRNLNEIIKYVSNLAIPFSLILWLVLIGAGLGILGSLVSLGKFFHVMEADNEI